MTVYLRAVSTQSGRVLKTVYTTKTIVSQKVDAGLFRYVDPKKLLETEVGYTFNEPPVLAVTEAIEESVKNLVLEGVRENMWTLADPSDINAPAFAEYDQSRQQAAELNYFGRTTRTYRAPFSFGFQAGAQQYNGNYVDPLVKGVGEMSILGRVSKRMFLGASFSGGKIAADRGFSKMQWQGDATARYMLLPTDRLSPYLTAGLGLIVHDWESGMGDGLFPTASAGAGVEYMLTKDFGFNLAYRFNYALMDGLDGVKMGRLNDSVWSLQVGFNYYTRIF